MHRFLIALAAALAASGSLVTAAVADDGDVIPTGCDAPLITDDTGDGYIDDGAHQLPKAVNGHAGPADMDITSTNLTWSGGHLVADIGIADLDGQPLPPNDSQGGSYYYAFFTTPDQTTHFVKAVIAPTGGDPTYSYGSIAFLGAHGVNAFSVYSTDGTTTGRLVTGKDGHVLIDVPTSAVGAPGATLTDVFANADGIAGKDDYYGLNNHVDQAPDGVDTNGGVGESVIVTDCSQVPAQ